MTPNSMSFGAFLTGICGLSFVLAGVLGATAVLMRRRLAHLDGPSAVVAAGTIATSFAIVVHLVPLALGVLARWSTAAAAAVALGVALVWTRNPKVSSGRREPQRFDPGAGVVERSAAAISLAAIGGAIVANAVRLVDAPVSELDMLTWNLPEIARWIQTSDLWKVHEFVPYWGHDNYPHNGDVLLLGLILPWENDFLARTLGYGFLTFLGVAVYALARELGARRELAATCSALVLAVPSVTLPTLVNVMPDVVLMATFAAGLVFLLRHDRTGAPADLVLAGLALGVAFGTKWYGVTTVAVTVLVWAIARAARGVAARAVLRDGAMLVSLIALTGGFWLFRNLIVYGNPLYPTEVPPLFDAPRDIIRELYGFTLFDYANDPEAWRDHILPAFRSMFAPAGLLIGAGAIVGGFGAARAASRDRGSPREAAPAALLMIAVLVSIAYALTPYSALGLEGDPFNVEANTRYAVPALIAGVGAACGLPALGMAWGRGFVILGCAAIVASLDLADLAPAHHGAPAAAALLAGWLLISRGLRERPQIRPAAAAAVVLVAAIVLVAAALVLERRFNDMRYGSTDPTLAALEQAPPGSRIALTGAADDRGPSPVFPAFGPLLANEVEYVGVIVDGQLRPPSTERQWRRLIRDGAYDLVLVGRSEGVIPGPPVRRWAARSRWPVLALSERFTLYTAPGHVRGT